MTGPALGGEGIHPPTDSRAIQTKGCMNPPLHPQQDHLRAWNSALLRFHLSSIDPEFTIVGIIEEKHTYVHTGECLLVSK